MESVLEFGLTVAFSVQGVRIEPLPIDESYNKQIAVDIILNSSWELNQLLLMYGWVYKDVSRTFLFPVLYISH